MDANLWYAAEVQFPMIDELQTGRDALGCELHAPYRLSRGETVGVRARADGRFDVHIWGQGVPAVVELAWARRYLATRRINGQQVEYSFEW